MSVRPVVTRIAEYASPCRAESATGADRYPCGEAAGPPYLDETVAATRSYFYLIRACNGSVSSGLSNEVAVAVP